MRILSDKLKDDLSLGKPIRLDLGCGQEPRHGFYAVDQLDLEGVDVVADLNEALEVFPNDCCEHVYSRHVLEHIQEFVPLMCEIHRITKPGGTIEIIVPHFSNVYGFSDPTHVRFFGLYSMYYFVSHDQQPRIRKVPAFYTDKRFRVRSVRIDFYRSGVIDRLVAPALSKLVNCSICAQDFYERRLAHMFHAWQIRYVLEPEK